MPRPDSSRKARALLPALVLLALPLAPVLAQEASAPTETEEDISTVPERGETVLGRSRPEVDPVGRRIGGFKFDASAVAGIGYDDNIAGLNNPRIGDGYAEVGARLRLASDWSQHAIGIEAGFTDRRYFNQTSFDWFDWNVRAFARYDVDADTPITASYTHLQSHLPPTRVDVQEARLFQPVVYQQDEFNIAAATRLNRIALGLSASYVMTRYDNISSAGPSGQYSNYDFDSLVVAATSGYEFAPGRAVTFALRYQNVNYIDAVSSGRSSNTWAALVGFNYDFDGVWRARALVGYAYRQFDGNQYKNINLPTIEADIAWNITSLTTLNILAGRIIQESISTSAASYVSSYGLIRADHELYRNIILSGTVGLNGQEYQGPTARAVDLVLRASAQWLVNRSVALTLEYQRIDRFIYTGGIPDYDSNVVVLRARVAL